MLGGHGKARRTGVILKNVASNCSKTLTTKNPSLKTNRAPRLILKKIFIGPVGVADFLYDLITRYGVAEIVMSDQGREFVNRVNEELFNLCGTDHRISSAYHPQSNGLDERMNQTLTRALVKFVNENQNDWDVHIKSILFAQD